MPNTTYKFKIANTEYPVVGKDYQVQNIEQYDGWTDANGNIHRSVFRKQMKGTFTMLFETIGEYNSFIADIEAHKNNDTSVPCSVYDNLSGQMITADYFLSFTPSRRLDGAWADTVGQIKVTVEER